MSNTIPLPTPYYPQWSHSNEQHAWIASQMHAHAAAVSAAKDAEIERLRDQLHLAEVVRAAQVEGLTQGAAGWRERANQLEAEVAGLTAERDTCGTGAGCLHKEATIDGLREKLDLAESKRASDIADLVQGTNTLLREQLADITQGRDAEVAQLRQYLDTAQRRASALSDEVAGLLEVVESAAAADEFYNNATAIQRLATYARAALAARKGTT